jgi:predicted kinase
VERKRNHNHGLAPLARSHSAVEAGLYAREATEGTYRRLREQAAMLLLAGWVVIVDATFLKRAQRDLFRALAQSLRVAFAIVDFSAPMEELRRRIVRRARAAADASDADLEVLAHQVRSHEALASDEAADVWTMSEAREAEAPYQAQWKPLLDRLGLVSPAASA